MLIRPIFFSAVFVSALAVSSYSQVTPSPTPTPDDTVRVSTEEVKINVGSALKSAFYRAVRNRIAETGDDFNPYTVVGSGLPEDVLLAGRLAVRDVVAEKMRVFGSAGRAE